MTPVVMVIIVGAVIAAWIAFKVLRAATSFLIKAIMFLVLVGVFIALGMHFLR